MRRVSKHVLDEFKNIPTNELLMDLAMDLSEMTGKSSSECIKSILNATDDCFRLALIDMCKGIVDSNGKNVPF